MSRLGLRYPRARGQRAARGRAATYAQRGAAQRDDATSRDGPSPETGYGLRAVST